MTEEERDELERRKVEALERIANKPLPTQRTIMDWWHSVPVGQEHRRDHYYSRYMRVRY